MKDITFSPGPGREIRAYLIVPKGNGPFAGILWVHWLGAYVSQADAAVLFAAAPEPKQRKLYEASHKMELTEIARDRDEWLVKQLKLASP